MAELDPDTLTELFQQASATAGNAYAPYSRFRVGAALLLEQNPSITNPIVTGCNVENASYRLTTCAEQAAVAAAVAAYGPSIRIRAVVIVNLNGAACAPCGACRQTLLEFASPQTVLYYPTGGGEPSLCTLTHAPLADLLPGAFTQASLT
jgi:cytidine deaminase